MVMILRLTNVSKPLTGTCYLMQCTGFCVATRSYSTYDIHFSIICVKYGSSTAIRLSQLTICGLRTFTFNEDFYSFHETKKHLLNGSQRYKNNSVIAIASICKAIFPTYK